MKKRYLYKLRPGAQARLHLRDEHAKCRWLWNECVHQFRSGQRPTAKKLDALLTQARAKMSWLSSGSSVVQQQTIRTYDKALRDSFKVKGRGRPSPKTRKRHPHPSLNYTKRGFSLDVEGRLKLAGGVSVPVVWSRDLPSEPSSVRVYEDSAGWWWASFVVDVPDEEPGRVPDKAIGIDWGVKTTAKTTDEDYDLPYRGALREHAAKLAKYQRRMARHKDARSEAAKRSYAKAKIKAAKVHRTVRWQRKEHARAWAQKLTRDHGRIAVEDFRPKFLAKTTMARKVHDAAIGQLKSELDHAASKRGCEVVLVPAAFTTMTCSRCGTRAKSRLPLSQRTFRCWSCGLDTDRDLNAALVVLYQAGFDLALDDGVSPLFASAHKAS